MAIFILGLNKIISYKSGCRSTYLLTYLGLVPHEEHRPQITLRRAEEDQPESSSLEGCCCGPLFHKESRGISQVSQVHWTLGCLFQLLLAGTAFMHFCLNVSAPCIPESSPLSLPLWVPGQCLPGDVLAGLLGV